MTDSRADGALFLGIEIGGTKLQACVGHATGRIIDRSRSAVDINRGGAGIRSELQAMLSNLLRDFKPRAAGVGFGGPVNWQAGQICCSHHIEGWTDFPLGSWLSSIIGSPVRVDNDANVAALAEATCGAGNGLSPVFYVTLGSGVGGGLIVDGKIFHGARPGEAEIGHLRLDTSGTILESRCSGWNVNARIRSAIKAHPSSVLAHCVGSATNHEAKFLAPALAQSDALANEILRELTENLSFGLSHVTHLFHPEIIVLGGGLSLLGEVLREAVEKTLPRFVMRAFAPGPKIALASLKEDAVPVGALVLAAL